MGARFSDAQCGFKAIRRDQARALLPLTQETGWFFDTELLVLAERAGLRIHEIPVEALEGVGLGRLGAGDGPGVQLHERHHSPLLQGRPRARHRRPGRHRHDGPVAGAARAGRADRGRRGDRVAAHFKKQTVGGETVYNLTEPLSS